MLWLLDDKMCFSVSLDLLKRGKPKIHSTIHIIYAQMTLSVFASPVQPNEGCLESLCHESNGQKFFDCLLLPGDLCTSEDLFEEVMGTLTAAFQKVFFCFGNHEAWTRGEKKGTSPAKDSFQKLERIHQICKTLGVYTTPVRIISGPKKSLREPWTWAYDVFILQFLSMISWYLLGFFFGGFQTWSIFECDFNVGRRWFRVHYVASTVVMVSFQLGNLAGEVFQHVFTP